MHELTPPFQNLDPELSNKKDKVFARLHRTLQATTSSVSSKRTENKSTSENKSKLKS